MFDVSFLSFERIMHFQWRKCCRLDLLMEVDAVSGIERETKLVNVCMVTEHEVNRKNSFTTKSYQKSVVAACLEGSTSIN